MFNIDKIIGEEINKFTAHALLTESSKNKIKELLGKLSNKNKGGKKHTLKHKKRNKTDYTIYDYDEYKRDNADADSGTVNDLLKQIDLERVNLTDLAKVIFPNHKSPESAQSHLRKILHGERPMSARIAHKLKQEIDSGRVPVK